MSAVVILIAAIIVRKASEQHDTIGIFIPKQGDGIIGGLLQVPETDDIAIGFMELRMRFVREYAWISPHTSGFAHPQGV